MSRAIIPDEVGGEGGAKSHTMVCGCRVQRDFTGPGGGGFRSGRQHVSAETVAPSWGDTPGGGDVGFNPGEVLEPEDVVVGEHNGGDVGEEEDIVSFLIIVVPDGGSHGVLSSDEADEEE